MNKTNTSTSHRAFVENQPTNKIWEKTISKESGERWDLALHLFQVERGINWKVWTHMPTYFFPDFDPPKKVGSTVGIPLNVSKWKCRNRGNHLKNEKMRFLLSRLWEVFFFESNLMGQAKESTNTSDQWRLFKQQKNNKEVNNNINKYLGACQTPVSVGKNLMHFWWREPYQPSLCTVNQRFGRT